MDSSTALVVMDVLNDIVHPDGVYAKHGYAAQVAERGVLERAATALDRARAHGLTVIHVVVGFSPDYAEWPPASPVFADARKENTLVMDTWGTAIHDAVRPVVGESVVRKRRVSPFHGTELDLLLRTRGVDTLLVAGVSTDLVVLAAARDGHDRDYRVVVLADACAAASDELHDSALTCASRTATVSTVDEALPFDLRTYQ